MALAARSSVSRTVCWPCSTTPVARAWFGQLGTTVRKIKLTLYRNVAANMIRCESLDGQYRRRSFSASTVAVRRQIDRAELSASSSHGPSIIFKRDGSE